MLNMAQEATLDMIDLQAMEVVNARVARRHMWLQQTHWSDNTKARLRKAPISGDGKLCGDSLKEILEDFNLVDSQLDGTDGLRRIPFQATGRHNFGVKLGDQHQRATFQGSQRAHSNQNFRFKKPRLDNKFRFKSTPKGRQGGQN